MNAISNVGASYADEVNLDGQVVLVTGGSGSFGKLFIRCALERYDLEKIIVFSRDELKQFEMANDLRRQVAAEKFAKLRFFIGDVRDAPRLRMAVRGVNYIVHAAALKHVPIAEYNPMECVKTNVWGAENLIEAAISENVSRVIALSTDKACNPINLYGATKLAADKLFSAANNLVGHGTTRFAVVRYGNVVGSRGSVVPFFYELATRGETIPITDERMTRFWITLQQGVDFVLSCFSLMQGGEIFVPKIPSMNVVELASVIAPGLPTKLVGIRPGEKLHEIMISEDDARTTIELSDRYVIEPSFAEFKRTSLRERGGTAVSERFQYSSDRNPQWLDREAMRNLLVVAS